MLEMSHPEHRGDRAEQRFRPCQISQWLNIVQDSLGTNSINAPSICLTFAPCLKPTPILMANRAT